MPGWMPSKKGITAHARNAVRAPHPWRAIHGGGASCYPLEVLATVRVQQRAVNLAALAIAHTISIHQSTRIVGLRNGHFWVMGP